jgi:hypothetical protein
MYILSGKEFNDKLANDPNFILYQKSLVKLTVKNSIHNGFKFKEGLNVDLIIFNFKSSCKPGGFYFTNRDEMSRWLIYSGKVMYWMWEVIIPDDAVVVIESSNKIKTDKFILENKKIITENIDVSETVKLGGIYIRLIENPSEELQLLAVKNNIHSLKYIKNPSESVQLFVVSNYGFAIRDIDGKPPSEAVQLAAVKNEGLAIRYIKSSELSEDVKSEAVTQNGYAIKYIENASDELLVLAESKISSADLDETSR